MKKRDNNMIHSFLIIGQSNMAGRGSLSDAAPLNTNGGKLKVLRNGRWQTMFRPVNPDRPFSGTCLAESFAKAYSDDHEGVEVGIIPCADGGTKISEWQPGSILYDNAVFMAKLAMRSSAFSGIIWHQGESDCTSDEGLASYKDKFVNFVNSLRRDLGAENLPFIAGEISEIITANWAVGDRPVKFNHMLRDLAEEIPHFGVASSNGLALKDDGVHFTAVSAREFGKRYFEIYKRLV